MTLSPKQTTLKDVYIYTANSKTPSWQTNYEISIGNGTVLRNVFICPRTLTFPQKLLAIYHLIRSFR